MGIGDFVDKAKQTIEDRGGLESLKEDAQELRDVAQGDGSVMDKAKEGFQALKEPGADGSEGEPSEEGQGQ